MRTTRLFFSTAKPSIPAFKFKFDRATADRKMAEHSSIFESGSRDKHQTLPELSKGDPVTECFVPCYSADIKVSGSEYTAEFGFNRTEIHVIPQLINNELQMVQQVHIATDWHSCNGRLGSKYYPFGTVGTQFYASYEFPRALIEPVIRTPFAGELKPLTEKMITAFGTRKVVKSHEMPRAKAIEKVVAGLNDLERERAKEAAISIAVQKFGRHPDGGVRIHALNVKFNKADFKMFSYFVGVYVYQYPFGDFTRYKFLNAHSGQINGNKVLSIAKFTTAGAIFGGMFTVLTALANPYLLPVRLSIQIAVSATVTGAVSAAFARLFNQYDRYQFVNESKREKQENEGYPRSSEDKETQNFADAMNKNYEYTAPKRDSDIPSLPKEKLSLLGLDPEMNITVDMLHKAYIKTLKECHPDLHKMNDEDANAMTTAVNDAYRVLKSILEPYEAAQKTKETYRPNRP